MKKVLILVLAFLCLAGRPFAASDGEKGKDPTSRIIAETLYYVWNDACPEQFGDKKAEAEVHDRDWAVLDLSGNGEKIVCVGLHPHYLQTPTILLYRVTKDGKVTPITEGLAPGPLVPNDGAYEDPHGTGLAVDMTLPKATSQQETDFVKVSLDQHMHVVRYPKFFHLDSRNGAGSYLDMSDHREFAGEETCAKFEFSPIKAMSAGQVVGAEPGHYLAVLVGVQIYLYQIRGISGSGYLDKKLTVIPKPKDFDDFAYDGYQTLCYGTTDGKVKKLSLQGENR